MTDRALCAALAGRPRAELVVGQTPLSLAPRLSAAVGCEIWFKRDDLCGRGLGGNKIRTLEYLLGDAQSCGSDTFVTGAGPQSNWAMLAALASRMVGLDPVVVHYGHQDPIRTGNLILTALIGARTEYTGDPTRESVDDRLLEVALSLRSRGLHPYVAPRGGATPVGCLGYVNAALELSHQLDNAGVLAEAIWLPTGSCGTQAGLHAGLATFREDLEVVGVATSRTPVESQQRVADLASQTSTLIKIPANLTAPTVVGGYIGRGYGHPTPDGRAASELVARTEGVLLDPVFGAKAMAALLDSIAAGRTHGPVVYLVTGGAPTLFVERMNL